ncbi:MAG: hypothetical protein NZ822_01850 [Patescibacteria group bacterium]|nr:hypothetical protein [Patescibacteria group bacterium]
MAQPGKLIILKTLYREYFEKLADIINPQKNVRVKFDLNNFFLKISLPYFRKLKIFHDPYSHISIKADNDNDRIYIFFKNKKILPDVIFFNMALSPKYKRLGVPIFFSQELRKKLIEKEKKIFIVKTGHFYFKQAYKKFNLDLAFEPSGHFYCFKDLKIESPYLIMSYFLHHADFNNLPKIRLKRLDIKLKEHFSLEKFIENLRSHIDFNLRKFDGYFMKYQDNYFHLRKSKTENKLRITFEGDLNLFKLIKERWLTKI